MLLLDTHVLLWWLQDSRKLGKQARLAIARPGTLVFVSAATAWEIGIKVALGRLDLGEPPAACLPRELARCAFEPLAITVAHAAAVADLPPVHSDPFDRLLVAQARAEHLQLVTADAVLSGYGVLTLDARV